MVSVVRSMPHASVTVIYILKSEANLNRMALELNE